MGTNTPEGQTKERIKHVLDLEQAYYEMPVPGGFGKATLDFLGARPDDGRMFAIESKALGKHPKDRQKKTMRAMVAGGITVFIIDDQFGTGEGINYSPIAWFHAWLANANLQHQVSLAHIAPATPIM